MLQNSECSEICDVRIPSVSFADSVPTPFGPSGHFPLIGGIGPWKGSQGVRRTPLPSPMRGRWHGEAVTDEVGALAFTRRRPPHQSPPATASPHRGSHPLRRGLTPQALRASSP